MIRVLAYLVVLAVLAYGGMLLVENPGHVTLTWHGTTVSTTAALLLVAVAVAAIVAWSLLRLLLGLPGFVRIFARQRSRQKGYAALSRGLIAVGSGDAREASRAATQAGRALKNDPLAIMLRAQAAHLNGDEDEARSAFETLAQRPDTRVLGLRGLHAEASRRGDGEAALHFASAAHRAVPLPWSAQAVLERRAAVGDWEKALATVETSIAAKLVDKETGERQRAVLETAIAYDKETAAPDAALALAKAAMRRAPDLAPPVVLAARLMSRQGEIRKAAKLIEKAWPRCQHPDIARAYLDVRPGDSTGDRLERAKTLMGIASFEPVSRMTVARAALAAKDFAIARKALTPLIGTGQRPSVRTCLLMAELEEAEHGDTGSWREWLARSSHASLDPAWTADDKVYDHWAPISPVTGKLDAFRWQVPANRLGPALDATAAFAPKLPPKPETLTQQVVPALPRAVVEKDHAVTDQDDYDAPEDRKPVTAAASTPPLIALPTSKSTNGKPLAPASAEAQPAVAFASDPVGVPIIEAEAVRDEGGMEAIKATSRAGGPAVVGSASEAAVRPIAKAVHQPVSLSSG